MSCETCNDHAENFLKGNFDSWLDNFKKTNGIKDDPSPSLHMYMRAAFNGGAFAGLHLASDEVSWKLDGVREAMKRPLTLIPPSACEQPAEHEQPVPGPASDLEP
jgi:hypothetical protein